MCFQRPSVRTLAWIMGKLHYGHPDFLNVMGGTERSAVERIFAGMNVDDGEAFRVESMWEGEGLGLELY